MNAHAIVHQKIYALFLCKYAGMKNIPALRGKNKAVKVET